MPRSLATATSAAVTARTWVTPPATPSMPGDGDGLHRVDDEQAGLDRVEMAEDRFQVGLGGQEEPLVQRAEALGPQPHLADRLLAGDDQARATRRRSAHCWATSSSSVDLPTPGSPASSTTAPGTMPPPSTRSSSPTPVGLARAGSTLIVAIGRAGSERRARASATAARPAASTPPVESMIEPHSPHSGQRPSHFGGRWPQTSHS